MFLKELRAGAMIVALCVLASSQAMKAQVDTFSVRTPPHSSQAPTRTPDQILMGEDVGERYCDALQCVVYAKTPERIARLRALESRGDVALEDLPDAHRVFFRGTTYDARNASFESDFPGRLEVFPASDVGQFVVVFKSYPTPGWLHALAAAGLTPLEPLQTMAYYFFGPRAAAMRLPSDFSFVYAVLDVPAGIRRSNIDDRLVGDHDGPAPTTVVLVAKEREIVLRAMLSIEGREPRLVYRTGSLEAYSAKISRRDALVLSALPEVFSITRNTFPGGPSDERANRIVGGTYQSPDTAWPSTLPSNSGSPRYWDNYLSQLSSAGLTLSNQVIGFLDTGVDSGLQRNSTGYCPPYLRPPGYPSTPCRLLFTTDVTTRFDDYETRGDDRQYHGTMVTSIAAGFATDASNGRDSQGYAFTQGVAPGAGVAVCQFWALCGGQLRYEGEAQPFESSDYQERTRYALVELGTTGNLPDGGTGPGARVFNHSWNYGNYDYEDVAILLDQTTRRLSIASFTFDNEQTVSGPSAPALHVVSAGNIDGYIAGTFVTAPGPAKNALTVGSTESYNQENYTVGCSNNNAENADNPHQIGAFSRTGFPNLRLKPDLVAPGTRMYGRRTVELNCGSPGTDCNLDLDGSSQYGWTYATSFSTPVVTGAAAVTREWLRTLGYNPASPALVKAALIATARTITTLPACSSGCQPCCSSCGAVRPSPDKFQGWGGVALDRFFRATSNYYFYDQGTTFTTNGQTFTRTLTIADASKDINIALVWTDRASAATGDEDINLVNDLDLRATISGGGTYDWYGNNYYTSIDSCSRNGYSLRNPGSITYDRKNNVERINIKASDIPSGATQVTITVTANSLTGDGIDPEGSTFRQDFALMAENARY